MPRLGDDLFHVKPAIAKGRQRLGSGLGECGFELGQIIGNTDAPTPPPAAALIITGKPVSIRIWRAASISATRPMLPGTTGTPAACAAERARHLVTHGADGITAWPHEHQPRRRTGIGEIGVFGEKP